MRSHHQLLLAGLFLLFSNSILNRVEAQVTLNWLTSYVPAWSNGNSNGNAPNIQGQSISCSTYLNITSGVYVQALGSSGAQTPTVTGATFTIPGSNQRLQVTPNFSSNTGYVNIVFNFSCLVTNISFYIADIDKSSPTSTTYFDKVTITGSNGITTFNPIVSKYDPTTDPNFLIVSGNSAWANNTSGLGDNTASTPADQRGTILVNFGSASINSITIRYDNAPGADSNTASQAIGIGELTFAQSTLPAHLLSFNGHWENEDVKLEWQTSNENNLREFIIERFSNGQWQAIGSLAAMNTNTINDYEIVDHQPLGNILLYRLKQVDIDGKFKNSSIIRLSKNIEARINCYPNPFSEYFSCQLYSTGKQVVQLSLLNSTGQIILNKSQQVYNGNNNFNFIIDKNLSPGYYFFRISDPAGRKLGTIPLLKN